MTFNSLFVFGSGFKQLDAGYTAKMVHKALCKSH